MTAPPLAGQAELQAGNSRRTLKNAAEGGDAPSTEALGVGATLGMVVRERLPDSGPHVSVAARRHRKRHCPLA